MHIYVLRMCSHGRWTRPWRLRSEYDDLAPGGGKVGPFVSPCDSGSLIMCSSVWCDRYRNRTGTGTAHDRYSARPV